MKVKLTYADVKKPQKPERVSARDIPKDEYKGAVSAKGAAIGSFVGYVAKLASDSAVKYGTALLLAGPFVGPALAKTFAIGSGSVKLVQGDLKAKGARGARYGGLIGGAISGFVAPLAKKLGIPIKKKTLEIGRDFNLKQALARIKNFNYSSLPRVGEAGTKKFMNALLPGDIILTKNYSSHEVSLVHNVPGIKQQFNRALIYKGEGKALEALTGASSKDAKSDSGVDLVEIEEHLEEQHHIVAVRTQLRQDQVDNLWKAAEDFKSSNLNIGLRYTNDVVFSSQFVDHVFNKAAPQVRFRNYFGLPKDVVMMDDLARGKDNSIVARAGSAHGSLDVSMSKFC